MKKTYFPPSILVLASQGFVDQILVQAMMMQSCSQKKMMIMVQLNLPSGQILFSISAWLITCRHTLTIYCGAESTVHGWYKK